MTRDEMIEILEEIARQKSNPNAAVAAIRVLRQLAAAEEEGEIPATAFDNLDRDLKLQEWQRRRRDRNN
jgi:hypothetical protein